MSGLKVPAGQLVHKLAPMALLNVPAAQLSHELPRASLELNFPGAHAIHELTEVLPEFGLKRPTAQPKQVAGGLA